MQGKQKRGPCLCCSQVAVSVTAANVVGEAGNCFCCFSDPCCKSHSSSLQKSCLRPVFVRLLFVPFSGLEEVPKEVQEGRILKNNFKETRIEPRKVGPVLLIFRCLLLQDELFHCQPILFRGRKRDVQGPGIESRSGVKEQCVVGLLSLIIAWIMCFQRPMAALD